jgi:hypothetical protein
MPRTKNRFDYCIKTISVVIEQCARIRSGRFHDQAKKEGVSRHKSSESSSPRADWQPSAHPLGTGQEKASI